MIRRNWIFLLINIIALAMSFYALFSNWDFKSAITLVGGLIFLLSLFMLYRRSYVDEMNYLSSPFSFLYYMVIPISLLSLFIVFMIIIYSGMIPFVFVQEGVVFVPLMIVFGVLSGNLKTVYYDKSKIYFHGWSVTFSDDLTEVASVKRYLFFFYKMQMKGNKSNIIFIPNIFEVFVAFGGKPKSVKEFILKINT